MTFNVTPNNIPLRTTLASHIILYVPFCGQQISKECLLNALSPSLSSLVILIPYAVQKLQWGQAPGNVLKFGQTKKLLFKNICSYHLPRTLRDKTIPVVHMSSSHNPAWMGLSMHDSPCFEHHIPLSIILNIFSNYLPCIGLHIHLHRFIRRVYIPSSPFQGVNKQQALAIIIHDEFLILSHTSWLLLF